MKKLIALVMVIGFASLATAGIVLDAPLTVAPGEVVTVSVVSDLGGVEGAYDAYVYSYDVALSQPVDLTGGDLSYSSASGSWWAIGAASSTGELVAGAHFTTTFTAGAAGDVYSIFLSDPADWTAIASTATITVVPEPMTLGLLGLGGLFLRRRK